MKKVLLDFDGVVVDLNKAIQKFLAKQNISFDPTKIEKYNYAGPIGCDRTLVFKAMNTPEIYKNVPFYKNAKKAVELLKQHVEVQAYTGAVNNPEIIKMRNELIKNFGLEGTAIVGPKPILSGYDALFDDCLDVHNDWINEDIKRYLINQPYNQPEHNSYSEGLYQNVIRSEDLYCAVKDYISKI